MRLLPYYSFQLKTPLPPEKALERLKSKIDQNKLDRILNASYVNYQGKIDENEFKIYHAFSQRNSYFPFATGKVLPFDEGSVIHIEMGMRPLTILLMVLWLCFAGALFYEALVSNSPQLVSSILLLLIGLVVPLGTFWQEVAKTQQRLTLLFVGTEIK